MSKRSSKHTSSSPVVRFLKEWGLFSIIVGLIIASRIYLWAPVKVDGHSMDPTLADSEYLLVVNHLSIDRFDIVVASEKDDDGKTKDIVKRVILEIPSNMITIPSISMGKRPMSLIWKTISLVSKKINCNRPTLEKALKKTENSSANWPIQLKPLQWTKMAILNLLWSCSTMNTSYLEMTGSFQKIAVRSELSRKNKSKGKPSLDYGRSTLSKLISID